MAEFYTVSHSNLSQLTLFGIDNIQYQNEILEVLSINDIKNKLKELYPNGISNHGLMYLSTQLPYRKDDQNRHWIPNTEHMESLFELVRLWKFADKPSRFSSFFGCETLNEAKIFRDKFRAGKGCIYKVSANSFFKADMSLLLSGGSIIGGYYYAERYWNGESSGEPFWEILMSSPIKVIECIDVQN